jgi:hypothetical protein
MGEMEEEDISGSEGNEEDDTGGGGQKQGKYFGLYLESQKKNEELEYVKA